MCINVLYQLINIIITYNILVLRTNGRNDLTLDGQKSIIPIILLYNVHNTYGIIFSCNRIHRVYTKNNSRTKYKINIL